jgi:hypothetical protein
LPLELGSGGLTKYNRQRLNITKSHWTDAACVGFSTPDSLNITGYQPLIIKAMGRGDRQMITPDKYGFPRTSPKLRQKAFFGFQTGDIVKAIVTKERKLPFMLAEWLFVKLVVLISKLKPILFKESVTSVVVICINQTAILTVSVHFSNQSQSQSLKCFAE